MLLQVIIEAPQSSGKQFAADIERLLLEDTLKARDQEQRRLEQEYREKKKRRKANEKLEEEPKTTIRVIPATISKTVLVKRADFYERNLGDVLSFWMFAEEQLHTIHSTLNKIMADVYTKEGALQPELNLDMSWLDKDVRRWCTTKGKEALESGSTALDVFRKRSSVSAFRVASLCYYLYQLEAKDQPSLSLSLSMTIDSCYFGYSLIRYYFNIPLSSCLMNGPSFTSKSTVWDSKHSTVCHTWAGICTPKFPVVALSTASSMTCFSSL